MSRRDCAAPDAFSATPMLTGVQGQASPQVLIVDKDRDVVDLLARVLECAGISFVAAFDGSSALELLNSLQPSVVVLEPILGCNANPHFVRELRKCDPLVAIIILTTLDSADDKAAALKVGADEYLTKPFSTRELQIRISAALHRDCRTSTPTKTSVGRPLVAESASALEGLASSGRQVS